MYFRYIYINNDVFLMSAVHVKIDIILYCIYNSRELAQPYTPRKLASHKKQNKTKQKTPQTIKQKKKIIMLLKF